MGERVERVDEQDRALGVVDRTEAIRRGWLHRVATIVCRDEDGRYLVHRRPEHASRFPGRYNWMLDNWMLGGAAEAGETYEQAAAGELAEELGVRTAPRFVLKFLCAGAISPYWLGLHEAVITTAVRQSAREVAWHAWLTEAELASLVRQRECVPDAREAYERYRRNRRGQADWRVRGPR
ncbi:NUDIX domain-containing protein [Streptomyces sp. TRM66268-LWL]|uniref:NUDIX domain-containing protein n=1 Tax=Streptomyces polyasparticus TaxID=2767826 RepID=A0ABR7SLS7_9ACTN|nr:NUDIX domain-containing protein [Streptomyces polyasparticus]MBC9716392.1 NUDIX domain-containing protein [Streptomyces polyasparticus]